MNFFPSFKTRAAAYSLVGGLITTASLKFYFSLTSECSEPKKGLVKITRNVSFAELKKIENDLKLIPSGTTKGKEFTISKKAKWVTDVSDLKNLPKNITYGTNNPDATVTFMLKEDKWVDMKKNTIVSDGILQETGYPKAIIVKDNEPGAYGIGIDLLEEFNSSIVSSSCVMHKKRPKEK